MHFQQAELGGCRESVRWEPSFDRYSNLSACARFQHPVQVDRFAEQFVESLKILPRAKESDLLIGSSIGLHPFTDRLTVVQHLERHLQVLERLNLGREPTTAIATRIASMWSEDGAKVTPVSVLGGVLRACWEIVPVRCPCVRIAGRGRVKWLNSAAIELLHLSIHLLLPILIVMQQQISRG